MTDHTDDHESVPVDTILGLIEGLVQNAAAAKGQGPVPMTDLAIQAQVTQAALTGYQVLATMRMAEATARASYALQDIALHFEKNAAGAGGLREALEGIRKVISSNGAN